MLAIFKYSGFDNAAEDGRRRSSKSAARGTRWASRRSTTTTSTGWRRWRRSAGSWSVSRTCSGNAGSFTNGMPMTASLGCGTWGGNITSENISVKHYMNTTWVSRPIPEDRPSERELLGEFYDSEIF